MCASTSNIRLLQMKVCIIVSLTKKGWKLFSSLEWYNFAILSHDMWQVALYVQNVFMPPHPAVAVTEVTAQVTQGNSAKRLSDSHSQPATWHTCHVQSSLPLLAFISPWPFFHVTKRPQGDMFSVPSFYINHIGKQSGWVWLFING